MTSKKKLYDLTLVPKETCRLSGLPQGRQLSRALNGCICSDLFVAGFSYKRLDLGSGLIASDDEGYRLLKRIKSAKYIRDELRQLPAQTLLQMLRDGTVQLADGYIGHTQRVRLALGPAPLSGGDKLFGIELQAGSAFRCFLLTDAPTLPREITVEGCRFSLTGWQLVARDEAAAGVLQSDLPLVGKPRVADDSPSRFKVTYDPNTRCTVLCAGSFLCPPDHFGDGLIL